jgi:opacity protein-like surface antigen
MRNVFVFVGIFFLSTLLSSSALADIMPPGTHEIGGSAELVFPEDGSQVYIGPRFGVVFSPAMQLEFEAGYARASNSVSNSRLEFATNFLYNFETTSHPYPFMLVGFGFARSHSERKEGIVRYESDDTNGLLNLGAGLRVPLTESSLVRIELRYTREFASPDASTTALRAGFSFLLE